MSTAHAHKRYPGATKPRYAFAGYRGRIWANTPEQGDEPKT